MYPGPPSPPAHTPRPNRLAAGLAWLVSAVLAVVATFFDIYHSRSGPVEYSPGFWQQVTTSGPRTVPSGQVPYGLTVVVGAAVVLAAALLVFLSRRRTGLVVGTFGTGMLVAEAGHWTVILMVNPPGSAVIASRLGFWLLTAAAVVAVVALVFAAVERAGPPMRPMGYGPPPRQQQPRWEPPTPRYGVPAQQQPPGHQQHAPVHAPPPSQAPQASQPAEPDRTVSTSQPEPQADPEAGQQKSD
jgi:hypothetical protein